MNSRDQCAVEIFQGRTGLTDASSQANPRSGRRVYDVAWPFEMDLVRANSLTSLFEEGYAFLFWTSFLTSKAKRAPATVNVYKRLLRGVRP